MNWFKSFWKKRAAPVPGAPELLEPISNFTPRAQQVLALARKEADRFNHNFLGTEHLLLGLIKLGQGVAVNVLQKIGLDLETVRKEVEKRVGFGPDRKSLGNAPYTPRVKKVLDLAKREAKNEIQENNCYGERTRSADHPKPRLSFWLKNDVYSRHFVQSRDSLRRFGVFLPRKSELSSPTWELFSQN